jgi:hypothetical protein
MPDYGYELGNWRGFGEPSRRRTQIQVRDRLRDGPNRLQTRIPAKAPLQATWRNNIASHRELGDLQGFFERSGAGVEPPQPGAARPHRF